jgi:oligopeptide/dipeptide ABC transporter ATP-binding protein
LLQTDAESLRRIRGNEIALVFQESGSALNPVRTVGSQLMEPLRTHLGLPKKRARERAIELFREVQIPEPESRISSYPHQLSGGMKQRVLIAMAIACDPQLVIADEPTTALDATLQAHILELLARLKEDRNLSLILITHDLSLVKDNTDRVAVMYAGRLVEVGPSQRILSAPGHPYTAGLWRSLPKPRGDEPGKSKLQAMEGSVPHLSTLPPGCAFASRCPERFDLCDEDVPSLQNVNGNSIHRTACYNNAAVVEAMSEKAREANEVNEA